MSDILPAEVIQAFKTSHNLAVGITGIDVTIFVPTNSTALESLDAFRTQEDRTYIEIPTRAFILWNPSQAELRKYNIFTEDNIPILCHLVTDLNFKIEVDSYLVVPIEYVPNSLTTNQFDIINNAVPNLHDKLIFKTFTLAPRRKLI